ncbi:MAG: dephospho-CoA kinase [Marinifilaceae bacterium]
MIKIAITGGIGSGKSTICKIIETLNFPVYYSDKRAKALMKNSITIIEALKELYGEDIYVKKEINRRKLASIIFNSKDELRTVNKIIHPEVERDFIKWSNCQKSEIVFQESAIVFESKSEELFDYIICVVADTDMKIERVIKRENTNREAIIERINNQLPQTEKANLSDFVIENSEQHSLLYQVNKIISSI